MSRLPPVRPGDDDDADHDPDEGAGSPNWRELFTGSSPRELLARLWDGDRLELWPRCAERVHELAYLLPISRVYRRAIARVAYAGVSYRGTPPFEAFLRRRIELSIQELLNEDREQLRGDLPDVDFDEPPYARVAAVLGIEPELAFHACVALNGLPILPRKTCCMLLVEGRSILDCVREDCGDPDTVLEHLQLGLRTLTQALGRTIDWRAPGGSSDGA